jgi:F0F1-type ATP synthase assembly protein I
MSGKETVPGQGRPDAQDSAGYMRALGLSTGWAVFSYLIAGMIAYGAIGWLISRLTHIAILFPLGMLVGLGISLAYVIHRYGRAQTQGPERPAVKERTSGRKADR